jgi:dTMP kinase
MGQFITFEGIEGCGKTTQIRLLGSFLERKNIPYRITREPGGTSIGEDIRKIFLHSDNKDIDPLTELLLITASRVQHVNRIINPALKENRIVICDRFFDATVAYQGYAGGLPLSLIYNCHELFLHSIKPDLTILLDCPVEAGLKRSRKRNKTDGNEKEAGRFEEKAFKFHDKVRMGYIDTAVKEPERFIIIDSERPKETVHEEIILIITERLRERGYAV